MSRLILIIAIACFATTCHANAYAYDHRDRVVQTVAMNHLGGIDRKSTAYDFAGRPIGSTLEHSTAAVADSTVVQRWRHSFDRHGRELSASLRFGAGQWQAISGKEYDAVGRIGSETIGEPDRHISRTYIYDIRSNPVSVSSYGYRQKLSFTPGGNISRMTWWAYGPNETERTYEFGYDALARLTSARYSEESGKRGLFDTSYSYDLNGNITALRRSGLYDTSYYGDRYGLVDDLTYSYSGNQVTAIADGCAEPFYYGAYHFTDGADLDVEYTYDANGNMTADLNCGITAMAYDLNNRPSAIEFSSGASVSYIYDADGRKLRTVRAIPSTPPAVAMEGGIDGEAETTVTDYCGDYIYEDGVLERINTPAGYLSFRDNHGDRLDTPRHIFFLRDHLGNNRVALDGSNGAILQINHYYPFGMPMNAGYNTSFQPWKFGGKEFDRTAGLDLYDFEARAYDPSTARFIRHDDLTEKYLPLSPYTCCANNPLRLIDPTGMFVLENIENGAVAPVICIYPDYNSNEDARDKTITRDYQTAKNEGMPIILVTDIADLANAFSELKDMGVEYSTVTINSHGSPGSFDIGFEKVDISTDLSGLKEGLENKNVFIGACNVGQNNNGQRFTETAAIETQSTIIAAESPLSANYKYDGMPINKDPKYVMKSIPGNSYIISHKGAVAKNVYGVSITKQQWFYINK